METVEQEFADQLNHTRLNKAYMRLAQEAQKIKESPTAYTIRGEPEQQKRKPGRPKKDPRRITTAVLSTLKNKPQLFRDLSK